MTEPKYFKIRLQSKDKEELDRRIADNESRGFELVKLFNITHPGELQKKKPGAIMRRICTRQ